MASDQPDTAATTTLLAWLRQRLMESGSRDAQQIMQVTIVYKRHDGSMATYARPVVEGTERT